jgi:deoxycytidylate deaminase
MYVVRICQTQTKFYEKTGTVEFAFRDSRPCAECLNAIKQAGIRKIVYSTANGDFCTELVKEMESTHLSSSQKTCIETGRKFWRF